jgi:hypothetical protein
MMLDTTPGIDAVLSRWEDARGAYPGWLTAPGHAREQVWIETWHRLREVLPQINSLSIGERIRALDELNWRFEVALVPLFQDLFTAINDSVRQFNPFQVASTGQVAAHGAHSADSGHADAALRECWLRLALAAFRYLREERRRSEFIELRDTLTSIRERSPDITARICHEECLNALAEMDDEEVRRVLRRWPHDTSDPVWQLCKAGVLAEIGQLGEAVALLDGTLASMRQDARQSTDQIPRLSVEGWAMLLARALARYSSGDADSADGAHDNRGRWYQLARLKCDPRPELELLEAVLNRPVPMPTPVSQEHTGFQPGERTRTISFNSAPMRELVPAYQYLRMAETAHYPPRCQDQMLAGSQLKKIGLWLARYDPQRAQSIACRLLDAKLIGEYLSRHRVASLSQDDVAEFARISENAIRVALPWANMALGPTTEDAAIARAHDRVLCGIEILTRITVRLPAERLPTTWQLSVALYSSAAVRQSIDLPRSLGGLFKSLLLTFSRTDLESKLFELMSLPIPGSAGMPAALPESWPDLWMPLLEEIPRLPDPSRGDDWRALAHRLLADARDQRPRVRGTALVRLGILYDQGYLNHQETTELASAYWERVDATTGLPDVNELRRSACLWMPERQPGESVRAFRKYVLGARLPPVANAFPADESLLRDVLAASVKAGFGADARRVKWSPADAEQLLQIIRNWWSESGRASVVQAKSASWAGEMFRGALADRISLILEVLKTVVIPTTGPGTEGASEISALVGELAAHGLVVLPVLPSVLLIEPSDSIVDTFAAALASRESESYAAALVALVYWATELPSAPRSNDTLSPMLVPTEILHQLGDNVAARIEPRLVLALNSVAVIIERRPDLVDDVFKRAIHIALAHLLREAGYRATEDPFERIAYDDVPNVRRMAARVAWQLASKLNDGSPIVSSWIDAAKSDPLPEIRRDVRQVGVGNATGQRLDDTR